MCQRRLHKGRFHWPKAGDALWSLTQAQFDGLVMGLQWERIDCTLSNNWHM
ncbi:IS66 family insertion sequence element accessory protein TnpB [Thiomicrospira microaerophila]|uniref:IS66 family insertion sequence element accessory protein TnpB n=1 Tax=Thiomicrospira microaerophila TaxID=406020 RepID=UPI00389A6797